MSSSIVTMPGVVRPMLWLAIPVLVQQVLTTMVGFVDTWLAARFLPGDDPLAAIGLMAYTLWLIPSMFATVTIGVTAMVARYIGADKPRLASLFANQAFACGIILSVVVTIATALAADEFIGMMNLTGTAGRLAFRYLMFIVPAVPAIMVQQVGIAALRAAGDTFSGFVVMAIVNVLNVVVSAILVTGAGPAPRLGWDGLAIGTAVGHGVAALAVLVLFVRGKAGLRLVIGDLVPKWIYIRRLLRIGLPGGADVAAVLGCHLWFLGIVNSLGTVAAAAHSLAIRIESIAYLPATAFQVAATTMAGQYLGAKDPRRAVRGIVAAVVAGVVMLSVTGFVFYSMGPELTSFFTGDTSTEAAAIAADLLKIVAVGMPSLAMTMILTGALHGAGDTRLPFLFTMIGMLGLRIPLAYWFTASRDIELPIVGVSVSGFDLGVYGAWYALIIDLIIRSLLVLGRIWHGGWKSSV